MEETKKYEPLRLKPCLRSYLWGGTRLRGEYHKTGEGVIAESWELSVRADGQTYIDSGEHCGESLADVLRADPVGMAGARCGIAPFPLLIKLIDAQKDLSVQVHPSDAAACREKGEQGKTEMWYVVDCRPESTLFLGFSCAVTPDELRRRAKVMQGGASFSSSSVLPSGSRTIVSVSTSSRNRDSSWPVMVVLR